MSRDLHQATLPLLSLTSWLKSGSQCGINTMAFFDELGLQIDLTNIQRTRISPMNLLKVLNHCTQAARQAHFPLVLGETLVFDHAPTAETFLATCPTIRDALKLCDWALSMINPWFKIALHEHDDEAWLTFEQPFFGSDAAPLRYVTEATMVAVKRIGFTLLGSPVNLRAVHFIHCRPDYHHQYQKYFSIEPKHNQTRNAIFFERRLLDETLPGARPQLNQQAQELLMAQLSAGDIVANFPSQVIDRLLNEPALLASDLQTVAQLFGMSGRTLQRRLSREGQGFTDVLRHAQQTLARRWLVDTRTDINTISTRLGYQSRRAFTSAFKHWTGLTPSQYRLSAR